ncbi:MAG TPA: hypothetical protein VNZ47_15295, partial [Candidatus Dormibacteraeota bacterium]|nr:hypothetical protein [Candidatus Dormibacteraeota bacterium]
MTIATIRPVIRSAALASLTTTARKVARESLAIALIVALLGNIVPAQELDSSTLQKEAAAQAAQKTAPDGSATPVQPQPTASQDQRPAPAPAQSQQQANQPPASQPPPAGQAAGMFTVPAGTKLPLGLLRPISVRSSDPVADVYLQITFPVTVGSQMLIPPGAYIQGVIQKTIPRPRGSAGPGFEMRFANLIFPTGYTVPIAGTVSVLRTTAHALAPNDIEAQPVAALTAVDSTPVNLPRLEINPTSGMPLLAMAAFGATLQQPPPLPLPPFPKSPFGDTPRNIFIGLGVAAALVTVLAIALNHRGRNDLNLETGTPLELVLLSPLQLDPDRVMAAVRQYSAQVATAPPEIVQPPKPPKMCYDLGSPGTPDTVIPGSPGTPDTVIPGV